MFEFPFLPYDINNYIDQFVQAEIQRKKKHVKKFRVVLGQLIKKTKYLNEDLDKKPISFNWLNDEGIKFIVFRGFLGSWGIKDRPPTISIKPWCCVARDRREERAKLKKDILETKKRLREIIRKYNITLKQRENA